MCSSIKLQYIHAHFLHLPEKPLLSSAPPLCDDFQIKWSSYIRATEDRQCHSAILSFSEPMRFWSPASPAMDTHPCLEVEFKKNHVVTSIELRGDRILYDEFLVAVHGPQYTKFCYST